MKYNPEMNRCRGADPRLIGEMLGTETVLESACASGCRQRSSAGSTCGCRMRNTAQNTRGGGCCEHGSQGMYGARQEGDMHGNGALASACGGMPSLAMVYSPHQIFENLYSAEEALEHGTLFIDLDKPWKVGGCR